MSDNDINHPSNVEVHTVRVYSMSHKLAERGVGARCYVEHLQHAIAYVERSVTK